MRAHRCEQRHFKLAWLKRLRSPGTETSTQQCSHSSSSQLILCVATQTVPSPCTPCLRSSSGPQMTHLSDYLSFHACQAVPGANLPRKAWFLSVLSSLLCIFYCVSVNKTTLCEPRLDQLTYTLYTVPDLVYLHEPRPAQLTYNLPLSPRTSTFRQQ